MDSDREFRLIDQLLTADPRNFHGWNYRRFVAAMKDVPEEDELQFTMKMIDRNFSNYSAWHNRGVLLSRLLEQKAEGYISKEEILMKEYDLVHQALFTDAGDQSGWFYYLWLLDQTVKPDLLLTSSWPVDGSDYVLTVNGTMGFYKFLPLSSSSPCYSLPTGMFPVILYFNQAVKGVSSSTVTVKSVLTESDVLIWTPISTTPLGHARCWMTYLKICDTRYSSLEACTVEVSLGPSEDITTLSGSYYSQHSRLKFTINMKYIEPDQTEQESAHELFSWDSDNMYLPEASLAVISFDQLRIADDDQVVESSKWRVETLTNEMNLFKEFFEENLLAEENSKFVILTLVRLFNAYDVLLYKSTLEQKRNRTKEVLKLLEDLIKLDPSHTSYYEDERSLVLINQVTFDKVSLVKHCWHLNKSTSSSVHEHACLRLNKLSLTRIGFLERLLWVQILDLSHNKLRSIEGLEALQLLSCLNLSNNCISSFTMLEPLKLLVSLKVLNLSYNEIGSHPVNTTKYLCASPFSHTKDIDWNVDDYQKNNINVADHWEAILLFKDLHLTQLEVKGNAVAGESLKLVLTKALPTLHWLDGELVKQ